MIQTTEMVRVVTTVAPSTCRRQRLDGLGEVWAPGEDHRGQQLRRIFEVDQRRQRLDGLVGV